MTNLIRQRQKKKYIFSSKNEPLGNSEKNDGEQLTEKRFPSLVFYSLFFFSFFLPFNQIIATRPGHKKFIINPPSDGFYRVMSRGDFGVLKARL